MPSPISSIFLPESSTTARAAGSAEANDQRAVADGAKGDGAGGVSTSGASLFSFGFLDGPETAAAASFSCFDAVADAAVFSRSTGLTVFAFSALRSRAAGPAETPDADAVTGRGGDCVAGYGRSKG